MFLKKILLKSKPYKGMQKIGLPLLLKEQATLLNQIRTFFKKRRVLEVVTPLLAASTIPDPNIQSFIVKDDTAGHSLTSPLYLQTSPEFAMKRLLASGAPSIFQISKAFRAGEIGALHNIEFTLLEWYRLRFVMDDLIDEVDELLQAILKTKKAERLSYSQLFTKFLQIDPISAAVTTLKKCAQEHQLEVVGLSENDRDEWLNLLLSHLIESKLGFGRPTFIYDFPAAQAALAKLSLANPAVAKRFEVYVDGIELANGFEELTDSKEQRRRFEENLKKRAELGLQTIPLDEKFLASLANLPPCSGVALGVDRLLMLKLAKKRLAEISYPF